MLNATSYVPLENGSISLILTLLSMAHLTLRLSVAGKQEIGSLKQIGTFWIHIWTCSITHFRVSMSPLIPFMLTGVHMYNFTMLSYLINWFLRHLTLLTRQVRSILLDKRSRRHEQSTLFFLLFYTITEVPLLRYGRQRWTIWVSTLPESQRSESIWNTMRNLWHLTCTFSPCLACDSACLVKYFWAA